MSSRLASPSSEGGKSISARPTLHEEAGEYTILLHHSPPKSYPEETHNTVQICVPYEGARYDVLRSGHAGTKLTHRLRTGDILVVPAGQPHAVNWLRSAGIMSLLVSDGFLENVLGSKVPSLRDAVVLHDPGVLQLAMDLRDSVREQRTSSIFLGSCAALIAYRVAKQASESRIFAPGAVIPLSPYERSRIAEYIEAHLHQAIRVAELAAIVGLSQWHFLRRFQVTEGTTPNRYIVRRRVERASELLASTERPITQISLDVGMSSGHLSRSFMGAFGVPPGSFRQRLAKSYTIAR